jgi:hypothetical protein
MESPMNPTTAPVPMAPSSRGRGRARSLAAARARIRARGAILVEAVVVLPIFIIIFAGIVFVGKFYDAKLSVMRASRQSAWTEAMANCGTAGDPGTTRAQPADDSLPTAENEDPPGGGQPDGVDLASALRIVGDAPHKDIATAGYHGKKAKTERNVTADQPLGAIEKSVSGQAHVMCNEAPFDADRAQFRQAAMQTFREAVLQ